MRGLSSSPASSNQARRPPAGAAPPGGGPLAAVAAASAPAPAPARVRASPGILAPPAGVADGDERSVLGRWPDEARPARPQVEGSPAASAGSCVAVVGSPAGSDPTGSAVSALWTSADASSGGSVGCPFSSRIQPSRDRARRARAWYYGPCLRGSAYSFGLIVQYVPLDAPDHVAPVQPGSNGSWSAPSYDVEPGVAVVAGPFRDGPRRERPPPVPDAAPGPAEPLPAGRSVRPPPPDAPPLNPGSWARVRGPAPAGRAPGVRRPSARPDALARFGSARQGSRRSTPGSADGRLPTRRVRPGPASWSYAAWIARNRGSAASPAASGWFVLARRR